jgi:hypothetical protein
MIIGYEHLFIFGIICVVAFLLVINFLPRMLLYVYKRAILTKGFGDGPIPVNTLYTMPKGYFADPLHLPASAPKVATTGVNRDTLLTVGWLDLSKGPLVLRVPNFLERYYSVQFTDPSKNINFAYVGTRATGTKAGGYVITGPDWKGTVPNDMKQISSPNNSVLIAGRTLVYSDSDLSTAYDLAKQIQITPMQ